MFVTGETVGLAEWIIDETCLAKFLFVELTLGNSFAMDADMEKYSRKSVALSVTDSFCAKLLN